MGVVPHRKACAKLPTGLPPPMRPSQASVLHRRMHPRPGGGYPSLCGGPTECSWTEGWERSWMAGGGPGSPGRSRLRARPGPLSWCPTGSFCRVVSCRLLRSSRRRTASKPRPLLPDRPQLSLIADAPHVFKSRGIRPSQRLGDTSMPPEVMGMLDK